MLRFGVVALGALTFLVSPSQTNAAAGVSGRLTAYSTKVSLNPCMRYGWHCGMRNYGHEHRENCHEGGYWGDTEGSRYGAWRRRPFGAGGRPVEN